MTTHPNLSSLFMVSDIEGILNLTKRDDFLEIKDSTGNTLLHLACSFGYMNLVEKFIKLGFDINIFNDYHETPLHHACQSNYMNIAQLLICHLADLNIQNNDGNTAFHLACKFGKFDTVQLLIFANVNLNIENNERLTALDLAMINNHLPIVSMINKYQNYNDLSQIIKPLNNQQILKKLKL